MSSLGRKSPNLDSVTTINADGSRYFLHPADVGGRWTLQRRIFGVFLMVLYAALPWIPVNGHPAVLLDVESRRFHLFGLTLLPQNLWLLFFGITGLGFALFFLTALLGRLWCGWACPYTVFLEHLFRRIERLIDGDAPARKALDAAPWSASKATRRLVKHGLYAIAATAIAHLFLSYFIPLPRLYAYMQEGPLAHATAFGIVLFLTLVLWFCFGWFREQFCIVLCPYGRLQSAMTDDDTVIIGYDVERGEPRGPKGKAAGACVDCRRCVSVCPTGIDIRNGLQLECIGCAACIDACDDIMVKVGRPKGLVRYDSQNGFAGKRRRIFRPRILLYSVLGLAGLVVFAVTASHRATPYSAELSRMSGPPYYADGESVRNHYQLRFQNQRNQPATFVLDLEGAPEGYTLSGAGQSIVVPPLGQTSRPAIVVVPAASYSGPVPLRFRLKVDPGAVVIEHRANFLGPDPKIFTK